MTPDQVTVPRNYCMLVLDDMESMRKAVIAQLKVLGVTGKIIEAQDVAEAKIAIKNHPIDYILSDWNLPDGTGFSFLKIVRAEARFKDTPFLMITTEDEVTKILDAINAGASNYLIKPWTPDEFNERFQSAYEKHNPNEKRGARKVLSGGKTIKPQSNEDSNFASKEHSTTSTSSNPTKKPLLRRPIVLKK